MEEWEERFSSNYPPDEHYFSGYARNVEIVVCDCDDDGMAGYPFRMSIESASWRKGPGFVETDAKTVAKLMTSASLRVFVPRGDWTRMDWDKSRDVFE